MEIDNIINHVKESIKNAFFNNSKLPESILLMEGMSGNKTRHLYNNLCSINNKTYLEIGTWKGSSFISAMYKNPIKGYSIDNWKEFGGPKDEFYDNLKKELSNETVIIIDKDCWTIDKNDVPDLIDIYLFDGNHTYEDHKKAITYYYKFLSKYSIIIIDDWLCDWADVKKGTMDGLNEITNLKVHAKIEIPLVNTDRYHQRGDIFWNGCGIFICERLDI